MIEYKIETTSVLNWEYLNKKAKLGYKLISVIKEKEEDGYTNYRVIWSVEDGKSKEGE